MSLMVAQLSALLRAGRAPAAMWLQAASSVPGGDKSEPAAILSAAGRAAALGLPVGPAIRRAAAGSGMWSRKEGAAVWDDLAVCLEAAEATGCPLAEVLDRLASHLEDDADAAAARVTALAGPKATAQILTVLPLVGLAVGVLIGANPVRVLLETPLGILCLVSGFILTLAGRMWSARLVLRAGELR
jgi:tight adherence protein B